MSLEAVAMRSARTTGTWGFARFLFLISCFVCVFTGKALAEDGTMFNKCLGCHPGVEKALHQKKVHSPFRAFQCSSCHNPHAAKYEKLITDEIGTLCSKCHSARTGSKSARYSHEPFRKGHCLSCHDPHGSPSPYLTKEEGQLLCLGCHEKGALLGGKNKHAPVRRGQCLSCHNPHGSDYRGMGRKSWKTLCQTCHGVTEAVFRKSHLGFSVTGSDCMSCHNPHAADQRRLIKRNQHRPFAQRKCSLCHVTKGAEGPDLKEQGIPLCLSCHKGSEQSFRNAHGHVGDGLFCVNCHSPHASDEGALKIDKERDLCFSCHPDTKERLRRDGDGYRHPLVESGRCVSCHTPHGSGYGLFFETNEIALCTGCHQRHATFTHPIGKKTVDPRSKGPITCISCHNVMGTSYPYALRFDGKKQLCVQCHKGY